MEWSAPVVMADLLSLRSRACADNGADRRLVHHPAKHRLSGVWRGETSGFPGEAVSGWALGVCHAERTGGTTRNRRWQAVLPSLGRDLASVPVREHLDLVAPAVAAALGEWRYADQLAVVEIDPDLADTAALVAAHDVPLEASANCVVVAGSRAGSERIAACLVRADTRVDVNNVVRRRLDVRKASFLPTERAVSETGMEFGGITPLGLPSEWPVLVAAECVDIPIAMIGSGVRRSKLLLPGALLADLPGAEVVSDLARPHRG